MTYNNNTQGHTGFPPCDALISANLSHAVHLPSSPLYPSLVAAYWSLNTRRRPWCFVLPVTTSEVSRTLAALSSAGDGAGDWHIAVRSGAHGNDNSNNIEKGVTIDLSQLNATTYDAAANIAGVGTGARWGNVYAALDKHGVGVTGGREGIVGVGGFLLGGGNSWYTARTGFACDSVINYEIVLFSGVVVNANASVHSDLWRALKGGGSNFGIVTRFDLEAFPAQNLSITTRTIGPDHSDEFIDAVSGFTDLAPSFRDNAMIALVTYDSEENRISLQSIEVNTRNDANTTAFDAFKHIPTLIPATKQSITLAASSNRSELGSGTRGAGFPVTISNDPRVMRYCIEQHASLFSDLNAITGLQNFSTLLNFQPLPSYIAEIGVKKGGNMLGLDRNTTSNMIIFIGSVVLKAPDSEDQYPQVYQKVSAMIQRIEAFSKSMGSSQEFIYLNYANAAQDALGSYGAANVKHIRQAANKYDPHRFFQKRVPGGFKIDRVG
ncbi:FAD-binding domain-containing protein [Periconia macrospinosa]|uniref:FAD-binding domain-containing protein n=1 Tax=Periconia macrospinosa TaxID=97972 RepID=A0A2V1DWT2_9PLEO|nr:FAD-binding domain-containing protein [Periconia macrospinosa]